MQPAGVQGSGARIVVAAAVLACALAAAACGSKRGRGAEQAEEAARLRGEVAALIGRATEAGASKFALDEFERGDDRRREADEALAAGDLPRARARLLLARSSLLRCLELCRRSQELGRLALEERAAAEAARERAVAAGATPSEPAAFVEALLRFDKAVQALEREPARALDDFQGARALFEAAAAEARETARLRRQLGAERRALAATRARAAERGAGEKAPEDWLAAQGLERDAAALEAAGEFAGAIDALRQAGVIYARALGTAVLADEAAAAVARQANPPAPDPPPGAPGAVEPEPPAGPGDPVVVRPTPGPAGVGFDPASYPQPLDADDERFLLEHVGKLSAVIAYDHATGVATLDYTNGRDLAADVDASAVPRAHLRFVDPLREAPDPGKPPGGAPPEPPFSFDANTEGFFFIPVPFRYRVAVEWEAQILTLDQNASLSCLVLFDPDRESYYAADFVHLSLVQSGARKWLRTLGGRFRAGANSWFEKKRPVPMRVEFVMPDPARAGKGPLASGLLAVTYDRGGEEAVNRAATRALSRGFVAFHWHRSKFEARRLRITGILDRAKAVALLREKLHLPGRRESRPPPDGPRDATGAAAGIAASPLRE